MSSNQTNIDYSKKDLPGILTKLGFALFGVGLVIVISAFFIDHTRAAFNNLILLLFLTSIGLGSLFFVALEYLAGAVWSTPFRRVLEFFAATLVILPIVALPLLFNMHDLFHWTHNEVVQSDTLLKSKSGYLNVSFFIIRMIAFFVIWLTFYFVITRNSKKQDISGDQSLTSKNIKISAVFMPFFALTVTFSAIDWIMSLEPHWFSTILGVYYFSGTVLAALAAATLAIVLLVEKGYFVKGMVRDHYYSLGALLFAFVNFWAYIAFSQYLLIWYANLPEETFWFLHRWEGNWMFVSIGLIIVHFIVPYFGLLSQPSKMDPKRLKFMSVWILFAHFYDLYWLVMPTYGKGYAVFGWIELGFPILAVGLLILIFTFKSKNQNLIPIGDPKLKRGLNFRL
jgi:hypothetical protein